MITMKSKGRFMRVLIVGMLLLSMMAGSVATTQAASLTSMTLTLSSSVPAATGVQHKFSFTKSTGAIKGIKFEYCTTGSGACSAPAGLSTSSATINAAATTPDAFDTWTPEYTGSNVVGIHKSVSDATAAVTIAFDGITNPSGAVPTAFFVRITTYSDETYTTTVDGPSQVVSAVVPVISLSGIQDAILILTVTSVGSGTTIGDSVDVKTTTAASTATSLPFGNFKPLSIAGFDSRAVAHTIKVVTNGASGYTASVTGGAVAMTRTGGTETIGYVAGGASDTLWDESSTYLFGVAARDAAGAGDEANEPLFGTAGVRLKYQPMSSAKVLASAAGPTSGVDTTVVYRVQVQATQAAGDYAGSVNYTVLPNF